MRDNSLGKSNNWADIKNYFFNTTQSTALSRSKNLAEVITFVKFVLPWTLPVKETEEERKYYSVARRFHLCRYVECGWSRLQITVTLQLF